MNDDFARIVDTFFRCVSFEEGSEPAYGGILDLCVPEAHFFKTVPGSRETASAQHFVANRRRAFASGAMSAFHEVEISGVSHRFGNVGHRLSAYDKRGVLDGQPFAARGVTLTQFVHLDAGWRISSMAWDDERDGLQIPGA